MHKCFNFLKEDIMALDSGETGDNQGNDNPLLHHYKEHMEYFVAQVSKLNTINRFTRNIIHDLNNQLGIVMGNADLIREKIGDTPKLKHFADKISTGIRHASDLTMKLLIFSPKAPSFTLAIDIHAIINEVIALIQHNFNRSNNHKKIDIITHFQASPSEFTGNPAEILTMILNLGLNSYEAIFAEGEINFTTSNAHFSQQQLSKRGECINPGNYICIDIIDSGKGIDYLNLKHIFEPLFTTKSNDPYAGMGLYVAANVARKYGGVIDVSGKPGEETAFTILLPIEKR